MVADIVAKYVPELIEKEKRSSTGAMYEAFCPFCSFRNTDWAGVVNKDEEPSFNNVCEHLLSHSPIKFNEVAKFVFTNNDPVFEELKPTIIERRNYSIDGAKVSEDLLYALINHEGNFGSVGNAETDRIGITKGGEVTKRGEIIIKRFENWWDDKLNG